MEERKGKREEKEVSRGQREVSHPICRWGRQLALHTSAIRSPRKQWNHQMGKENRKTLLLLPCQRPACYKAFLGMGKIFNS